MPKIKMFYENHLKKKMKDAEHALNALNYSCLVLGSGEPFIYYTDDSQANFVTNPHFASWCPLKGPHHFIKYEPTKKPLLIHYSPDDFWHEHEKLNDPFWLSYFDIIEIKDRDKLWSALGNVSGGCFLGNETKYADASGISVNCQLLNSRMNWYRRYKSDYEIHCLSEANHIAAKGHVAAKNCFLDGGSEFDIHMQYLSAIKMTEEYLPYQSIVGLNKNAAILHYRSKQHINNGKVLLIDAGAKHNHYCSDITRTYTSAECDPLFKQLCKMTIEMQNDLVNEIKSNLYFPLLHDTCHLKVAAILDELKVIYMDGNYQEAVDLGITKAFFPHGLGHMLGVQVHDIGGKQLDEQGNIAPLNKMKSNYRSLRFVGTLEENSVVTVEPGIYFIKMLLKPIKDDPKLSKFINWNLVEKLIPCGGIRIEDDILVTKNGNRNLTHEHLDY
jgi:Xaa-Pro dipeptidase